MLGAEALVGIQPYGEIRTGTEYFGLETALVCLPHERRSGERAILVVHPETFNRHIGVPETQTVIETVVDVIRVVDPRIAHGTDWATLSLTKEQWQAVHTLASLVFIVGGLFHAIDLNRRAIWNYLKRSRKPDSPFRMSLLVSVVLSVAVLFGTVAGIPPFSFVTGLGEWATESWETPQSSAPAPHAEEWTLRQVVESLGIDSNSARTVLETAGFTITGPEQTLRDMADNNDTTPAIVYQILTVVESNGKEKIRPAGSGQRGLGRRSLNDITDQAGIPLDEILARLKAQGIDAESTDTLRDLSKEYNKTPGELWALVTGENPH